MPDDSNDGSTAFLRPDKQPAKEREGKEGEGGPPPAPRKGPPRMAIPVAALPKPKPEALPSVISTIPEGELPAPEPVADPSRGPQKRERLTPETAGRYLMKKEFGRGGQSTVWLALDTHVGREVAFKQLLPQHSDVRAGASHQIVTTMQIRFVREARITGQLEHPNIVPVYEVGRRPDGSLYYTQKLVRGRTLTDALKGCKDLRERLGLLSHFSAVCQAMAYAHKRGVIHRDIKPDNVMVGEFGETVVLDWGLARQREKAPFEDTDEDIAQTQEGDVMGTPAYMSPEQAMGSKKDVDEQSDVWSLGALLYEILTGRPPFVGRNLMAMLMAVAKDPIPAVKSLAPKAPPELAAIALKALTRDKSRRYRSAAELLADVESWRSGGPVSVYRYTPWQRTGRWVRKNRYVVLTAALVLLAILGGAARVWRENRAARRNLAQAFLEKSAAASRDQNWARAAAYAAAARVEDDTAEARWRAAHRGPVELQPVLRTQLGGPIEQLSLSPDGKQVAAAVAGQGVKLVEVATGKELAAVEAEGQVSSIAWAPDGALLAICSGSAIGIFGSASGEAQMRIAAAGRVGQAAFSPDGARLASAEGNAVRIYDAESWKLVSHLEGHVGQVTSVAFSTDGKLLASAGEDGSVRIWSPLPARPGARVEMRFVRNTGHAPVARIGFASGHLLAVGSSDATVRLFDADTTLPLVRINGASPVTTLAPSNEGLFAALSQDNQATLIDAAAQSQVARIEGEDVASAIALSADASAVAIANRDGRLRAWKVAPGARIVGYPAPKGFLGATAVALAPSGKRAAVADVGGHVLLIDLMTGKLERTLELPPGPVSSLAWSPGAGKWLAAAGAEEAVSLFEVATGARSTLEGHSGGPALSVAFSPDGKLLASSGSDGTVRLWDPASATPRASIDASQAPVNAVAFSPDGKLLGAAGEDRTIRIFDVASRRQRKKLEGAPDAVLALAFSPHASLIASSGKDQAVRTWRVGSGELRSVWNGHGGRVWSISFAPDGETLASASIDGSIRLWDVRTGRQVVKFERPPDAKALAFSKDGSLLVSAGERPALQVIEIDDKSTLLKPEKELERQLKRHKLRLDGIQLIDDADALAAKPAAKRR